MDQLMSTAIDKALANPVQLALGAAIVLGVVYVLGRKTLTDAGGAVAGAVSGNNAATRGTPYEGAGVLGTMGAVVNDASGGLFQQWGEAIGGWVYDVTRSPGWRSDVTGKFLRDADVLAQGAANTDAIWGRQGSVELRR
jgi:hypothetical protein